MNKRWFGVPRWAVLGAFFGVFACIGFYSAPTKVSAQVHAVIEGFRHGSVYVQPGAPPVVNPDRVRAVIGDRPIVVAILADEPLPPTGRPLIRPRQQFCRDVADQVPTNEVIVFGSDDREGYGSAFCTGDQFSNPDYPVAESDFDLPLIVAAETAWKYRISATDLTPKVEEYVLAFDAVAAKARPQTVPRRGAVPDELASGDIVLALGGIMVATVAAFFLLSVLARLVGRDSRRRRQRLELSARLSRIGEYIMQSNPDEERQAYVAKKYVLTLHGFEAGDDVEDQVTRLEELTR